MPMVLFLPWCKIDKAYEVGDLQILPFERHQPIEGLDAAAQCCVNTILASYKTIEAKPVERAAILRYGGKPAIADLDENELQTMHELVEVACFCGLAARTFCNGSYCNSDCFALYVQRLGEPGFTFIETRRRDGTTSSGWPIDRIAVTIPVHCNWIPNVTLDEPLLKALVFHREADRDAEWAKWQNAITCFNQANTDSWNILPQVEWVLLCSAFEHILSAKSNAKDVAAKFAEVMVPTEPLLACNAARGRQDGQSDNKQSLRYEWMREFYRIRGDFAHGQLNTKQHMVWNPYEHLFLATIAFPLVVRCLLEKKGHYRLTKNDRVQIEAFEKLAATPDFMSPPAGFGSNFRSHWWRICTDCEERLVHEQILQDWEQTRALLRWDEALPEGNDTSGGDRRS